MAVLRHSATVVNEGDIVVAVTNVGKAPAGTFRLARMRGIDLLIRPSLLLMGLVLVLLFAPRFATSTQSNPYVLALLFVLALYLSVLIHELAHVWAARHYRMPVASITLHLLGGETAIEGESRTAGQEFWTSFVGPVTSLLIGLGAWLVAGGLEPGNTHNVVFAIAAVNILVGLLNLVPGLPLDGGRVFRAVIWKVTGQEATGIKAAAWTGRLFALAALALPIFWWWTGDAGVTDVVVGILVAWFLWVGAGEALKNADRTARLNLLNARHIGQPELIPPADAPSIQADLSGASLLRAMAAHPSDIYRLNEPDGSLFGSLVADRVDEAYRAGSK